MNSDVEFHIRHNYPWTKLPVNIKQSLGNSQKEYEKAVVNYSVKNQLRYKGNLVRHVKKEERKYYEQLLQYSREHLMLYPYHLSDVIVKGLRTTPFAYYINIMTDIMGQEKSYDSLPNFTAADCLRLLGIGRNQYIDLMNQCRSSKKFFRKRPVRELLPIQPIETFTIDPWWLIQAGYITEDDVKMCTSVEKNTIDTIIDSGAQVAGTLDYKVLHSLYRKGLVYIDCPIDDNDCIIVPPLEGFVMNRVLGDYFETLLYKIFVSIDEHTSVAELANVLQIDLPLVKNAVSMYCRLGFAKKKGMDTIQDDYHPSWYEVHNAPKKSSNEEKMLIDWSTPLEIESEMKPASESSSVSDIGSLASDLANSVNAGHSKRIGFLFDSTLTAFLMMGNLSPGLKSHAVTMFEVGKLSDESLDSFLSELDKVNTEAEGEAQRYFDHAITLRDSIKFLRYNKDLSLEPDMVNVGQGLDLIRCESLLGLDRATCARVLNKNYNLLVSMAPLSNEIRPVSSCSPPHIGPAIPEVNSVWFKLFIYHLTGCGPPSLLLVKGSKLKRLPKVFMEYERLLVTTWGHDPGVIATSNILLTINDALTHSAVLVQAHGLTSEGETAFVPFPLGTSKGKDEFSRDNLSGHSSVQKLTSLIDLEHTCGYITLLKTGRKTNVLQQQNLEGSDMSAKSNENPINGFKDHASAQMMASELDSLEKRLDSSDQTQARSNQVQTKVDQVHFSLELENKAIPENPTKEVENDWVLLDCCFGLPLFESEVNKEICERISSQGLCSTQSLEKLLESSRKLTLQLLSFINDNQSTPILMDNNTENTMYFTSVHEDHSVPFPTHNLLFDNGNIGEWQGM